MLDANDAGRLDSLAMTCKEIRVADFKGCMLLQSLEVWHCFCFLKRL